MRCVLAAIVIMMLSACASMQPPPSQTMREQGTVKTALEVPPPVLALRSYSYPSAGRPGLAHVTVEAKNLGNETAELRADCEWSYGNGEVAQVEEPRRLTLKPGETARLHQLVPIGYLTYKCRFFQQKLKM